MGRGGISCHIWDKQNFLVFLILVHLIIYKAGPYNGNIKDTFLILAHFQQRPEGEISQSSIYFSLQFLSQFSKFGHSRLTYNMMEITVDINDFYHFVFIK